MSTSRGNASRKRPQKHQNRTAFKNDLHDTSRRTKLLNNLEVSGVCNRCKEIIEWKIKYKKYKPLTAPAKCVGCNEKAVKHAYHVLCSKCSAEKKVCAKCCKPANKEENVTMNDVPQKDEDFETMLKDLPERKRRTVLRHLKNLGVEGYRSSEAKAQIEEVMTKLTDFKVSDDDDFGFSSDEEERDETVEENRANK